VSLGYAPERRIFYGALTCGDAFRRSLLVDRAVGLPGWEERAHEEAGDVVIALCALMDRLHIDLAEAVADRWPVVRTRTPERARGARGEARDGSRVTTHRCRRSCPALVPADKAFCRACWASIPGRVQNAIYASWRRSQRVPGTFGQHVLLLAETERALEGERAWPEV
jgi:hypothetical protein